MRVFCCYVGEWYEPNLLKNISPSRAEAKRRGRGMGSYFNGIHIIIREQI